MISYTNIHNFVEKGEDCASTISVGNLEPLFHILGYHMKLFGSDMILFGSGFKFQYLSVMLVAALINFGLKNQVHQVSFKIVVGDLISFHTFGSDMNLFGSDMISCISDLILTGSNFIFQELSVLLEAALTNFGVKNQVPQFFFKFAAGDLVLVSSYEVADILFCESLAITEAISDYGARAFTVHSPRASLPLVT